MKTIITIFIVIIFYFNSFAQPSPWSEQFSGVSTTLTSVWCNDVNVGWICGYSGTVLRTTNRGINWINLTGNGIPTNVQLINICGFPSDNNSAITAGYLGADTWVWRTTNGGLNWIQVFSQPGGFINSVWMITQTNGFMMGDPVNQRWSLWKTTNGGLNWDSTGLYLPQSGTETGYNNSMICSPPYIWFGTNNSRIYFSSNNGISWNIQQVPEVNSYALGFNIFLPTSVDGFFGGANLYKTTNSGINWSLINSIGSGNFGGITTTPLSTNNPFFQPVWYVRSTNSIYFSSNSGLNWIIDYTNSTSTMIYRYISHAIPGRGIWAVGTFGKITFRDVLYYSIKKNNSEIPDKFCLSQNYPNPFNQSTIIEFSCPVKCNILLEVYDITGKLISVLINNELEAGTYQTKFDAFNLTSGIYFYKLTTEYYSETKKLSLIK